jgi:2-polyprenyl-3-methyl-5-hydroxy-6-metoxy-1,4-benzoquinol methylase
MSNNHTHDYGWTSNNYPESCNYITPEILKILNNMGVERVADIGSGNGSLCAELAKNNFYCIGIEYDKGGVEVSKKNYPAINFYNLGVQDDAASLINKEGKFDAVVSTEVIEHLFSPHLLPLFAQKILKPNGKLIITTPYHGYLKNILLSIFNKWDSHHTPLWEGGHIKFWSRMTLQKLLEKNGFKVVEFQGAGRVPFLWKSMIITAVKI